MHVTKSKLPTLCLAAALGLAAQGRVAHAQGIDIEIPVIILEDSGADTSEGDTELDLANIVQSAAKGVTTVQEAPTIITVITNEDIESRGFNNIQAMVDTVPGFLRVGGIHSQFPFPFVRGHSQATLFLHNGLSLFDGAVNTPSLGRVQPMETIKRVEMVTGPGGVLWGANSLLGILNIITKDAEDVDGVEAGLAAGDGNGDRGMGRAYVMAGVPELWNEDSKLFLHASFETFVGAGFEMPNHLFSASTPQPNSNMIYGPLTEVSPKRSMLLNLSGKVSAGNLAVYFQAPFVKNYLPLNFAGSAIREHLPEDTLRNPDTGMLECPDDGVYDANDRCLDRGRAARDNEQEFIDRYVNAEYRTRLADGKAGITLRGYVLQNVRVFKHLTILPPLPDLLEGGLAFKADTSAYRVGGAFDGDYELPGNLRMLYGAEAFHEWNLNTNDEGLSRQGDGILATFFGPYQLDRLPLPCPKRLGETGDVEFVPGCPLTFAFKTNRSVLGAYLNPQWRPSKKLILDAGARIQAAPEQLGEQSYDLTPTISTSAVYNFIPDWYLKLNYTEGFRPPVFNSTVSNGESVQVDGRIDLKVETSQAAQAEVNARIFKGSRRIRELSFRADYSYTRIENFIEVVGGRYENNPDRAMHSAELLGRLYVQGGHRLDLGYTYLTMTSEYAGRIRSVPEHWFNLSGFFNVVDEKLALSTNLRVIGAAEKPSRLVEYRGLAEDEEGVVIDAATGMPVAGGGLTVTPSELVMDRLPPGADLTIGFIYSPMARLTLTAFAYNALNARYFQPPSFYDLEPRFEVTPNPYEDFRFTVGADYKY